MRRWMLCSLVLATGCGSFWVPRSDIEVGCPLKLYYPDADEDGWGHASATNPPQELCEADAIAKLTASNGIDCDDDDKAITGKTGAMCPDEMVGDSEGLALTGMVIREQEFVATHSGTVVSSFDSAITACDEWGGQINLNAADPEAEPDYVRAGHLATFDEAADVAKLLENLWDAVRENDPDLYAAWLGIGWKSKRGDGWGDVCVVGQDGRCECASGDFPCDQRERAGEWGWVDDSKQSLIGDFFDFCPRWSGRNGPDLSDFWPNLNVDDPDSRVAMEDKLEKVRLALVHQGGNSWCLGLPSDAANRDNDYSERSAHFICERPQPDPAEFEEFVAKEN